MIPFALLYGQFLYLVLREKLCLFAQRYKDTNSYLDNIGSKIRKDIIILTTPSIGILMLETFLM